MSIGSKEKSRYPQKRIMNLYYKPDRITKPATMDTIAISGDTVQLQFFGVTLAQTAKIVQALEASPLVAGTTVNIASTTENEGDLVRADILIHLQKEVEE